MAVTRAQVDDAVINAIRETVARAEGRGWSMDIGLWPGAVSFSVDGLLLSAFSHNLMRELQRLAPGAEWEPADPAPDAALPATPLALPAPEST